MLKVEKIQKLIESTRGKGNTTVLLDASDEGFVSTPVDVIVGSGLIKKLFNSEGYQNVETLDTADVDSIPLFDNGTIYDAITEVLKYVRELERKLEPKNEITEGLEVFPVVKVVSGRDGHGFRFFMNGQEIKTVTSANVDFGYGKFTEVTLKFTAIVEPEECVGHDWYCRCCTNNPKNDDSIPCDYDR
jgi:hypothetical protein